MVVFRRSPAARCFADRYDIPVPSGLPVHKLFRVGVDEISGIFLIPKKFLTNGRKTPLSKDFAIQEFAGAIQKIISIFLHQFA
ncbi:hypothetical protein [Victivallis sp. Marseille-Q1083]|uniref:hypothetical protein n=1 Tax=Victivallis sp. Marseille-Q1083 TaxID=2717288 RepID=UPI00158F3319|nr:hypothetical protein [Victivallis sp. Marseille-Q1083]